MPYNGSPWRSRFLRSPRNGLQFAARYDFVALGDVAEVKLRDKDRCGKFFFVMATGFARNPESHPRSQQRKGTSPERPLARASSRRKSGHRRTAPGGSCPHVAGVIRRFILLRGPAHVEEVAREYVARGELQSVHEKTLVRSNATAPAGIAKLEPESPADGSCPTTLVTTTARSTTASEHCSTGDSRGRPERHEDVDLLGAMLNTTPVTLMRLLEGVTTGNEGAFDVGPPSARVMRIPDPRKMAGPEQEALDALSAIRATATCRPRLTAAAPRHPLRRGLEWPSSARSGYPEATPQC